MGIKLRTEVGDDPKMSMRYEWFRDLHGLTHDAAVAHALVRAIEEFTLRQPINRVSWADNPTRLMQRTAEILRDDFGIAQEKEPQT